MRVVLITVAISFLRLTRGTNPQPILAPMLLQLRKFQSIRAQLHGLSFNPILLCLQARPLAQERDTFCETDKARLSLGQAWLAPRKASSSSFRAFNHDSKTSMDR